MDIPKKKKISVANTTLQKKRKRCHRGKIVGHKKNCCLLYSTLPAVVLSTSVVILLVVIGVVSKKTQKHGLKYHQLDSNETTIDRNSSPKIIFSN